MTEDEAALLYAARDKASRSLQWQDTNDRRFIKLLARPCPFLGVDKQCTVYDIRPYNCRRFICGRPSGSDEPWEESNGRCANFTERQEQSIEFFTHAVDVQSAAQPWAICKAARASRKASMRWLAREDVVSKEPNMIPSMTTIRVVKLTAIRSSTIVKPA